MNCDIEIFLPISTLMTGRFLHQKIKGINQSLKSQWKRLGSEVIVLTGRQKTLESNNLWPPRQRLLVCRCNIPVRAFASFIKWDLEGNAPVSMADWEEQAAPNIIWAASLLARLWNWRAWILRRCLANVTRAHSEEGCQCRIRQPDACMRGSSLSNEVGFRNINSS